jgi:bifunctional non-homologous end joining protein LigD
MGLEGIIAKKATSAYTPGLRSKEWLKVKTQKQQEVVIAGYTKNENTSKLFSALLAGIYENGELIPIVPIGTGFSNKMQAELMSKLKPLETKRCPFAFVPDFNKASRFRPNPPRADVVWVKPELVGEISYRTVSSDGTFRHPSFKGLRPDKDPKEVKAETIEPLENVAVGKKQKRTLAPEKKSKRNRTTIVNPTEETQVRNINGHEVKFTNLSKIFWPKQKVTKRDMINYYYTISPFILPYLKHRPQTLNRFPNGVEGKSFYQKDVSNKVPAWIDTFKYYSEADKREKQFIIANNEESLLYIVNLGCIEINPWSSRSETPDQPDWCIIDLDPDKNSFDQVIEAAQVTHQLLDSAKIPNYCKTSGSTGLHIYIPLGAKYTYDESKEFARVIATLVQKELPSYTTIERLTSNRKGKMYVDFLQNRPQATVAGVYSLRPKADPTVSMPLHWHEVRKGLKMKDFTIHNALERVKAEGDIFKPVLGKGIDMEKALRSLERLVGSKNKQADN